MSRSGFESTSLALEADPCLAGETCGNGTDDDCDGLVDEGCGTACGSLTSLNDDFDDPVRGPGWAPQATSAVITETGGVLNLMPTGGNGSAGYVSAEALAVAGGQVTFEVVEMVDTTTTAFFMLSLIRYGVGYLNLRQSQGSLVVEQGTFAGDYTALTSVPYDADAHRWWRLVFDAQNGAAEVSADGATWNQLATFSLTFPADLAHIALVADGGEAPSPGQARVDNFNGPGAGALSNCPIDGLGDDFNDGVIGPLWDRSFTSGGSTLAELAGDIVLSPAPMVAGGAGLYSSNSYDLRNRSLTARVTQVLAPSTSTESVLRVLSGTNEAFFLVRNNRLIALVAQNGSNVLADIPYNASQHRCWRFRESGGTLSWETAGGACDTFSTVASMAVGFDLSSVAVIVFAQSFAGIAAPGNMHVDSLTIP
ncbi:MAG: hypothetical protein ACAI38_25730 [Myxococcota bacterium]